MIFVATGTTGFDVLVAQMDHLAPTLAKLLSCKLGTGDTFLSKPNISVLRPRSSLTTSGPPLVIAMEG